MSSGDKNVNFMLKAPGLARFVGQVISNNLWMGLNKMFSIDWKVQEGFILKTYHSYYKYLKGLYTYCFEKCDLIASKVKIFICPTVPVNCPNQLQLVIKANIWLPRIYVKETWDNDPHVPLHSSNWH